MGLIQKVAMSNWGQKFYKFAADPNNEKFFNNTLPTLESITSGIIYIWATARQKDIDDRRRHLLQTQNILTTVGGVCLGQFVNKKVSNYAEKVIPHIKEECVRKDLHKVVAGLKILLPLLGTACIMRLGLPVLASVISGKVEEKRYEKKNIDLKG